MTEKTKKKSTPVKHGLYKRGNSWCIRVVVNGVLERRTIGPDKAKAQAVLAEIKSQRALYRATGDMSGLATMFKKKDRQTFAEAAESYMKKRPHLKASTQRGYKEIFKNHLLPKFGNIPLEQITEDMVREFQADVSKTVSASRTNNIMGPLRYILKASVRNRLIVDNPALNVDTLREEAADIDPLSVEELEHVLTFFPLHQRPLFTCLAWTGARPCELFALRWSDVSFDRNEITISKGRVRGREGTTKTVSSKRIIGMLSIVRDTLLEQRQNKMQHLDGYVFLNKHGRPYSKHVDREWRTALKKAGIRHRPAYQLRHTFASICLGNGRQPTWIAKILGHSSVQITFKHYARFIKDDANLNELRMEEFLKARKENSPGCAQNWSLPG
jgi:integrase